MVARNMFGIACYISEALSPEDILEGSYELNDFVQNQIGAKATRCQKIHEDKNKLQYFGHIFRRAGDNMEKIS